MKHVLVASILAGILSLVLAQSGGNAGDPDVDFDTLDIGISAPCVNIIDVRSDPTTVSFNFTAPTDAGQGLIDPANLSHLLNIDVTTNCPLDTSGTSTSRGIDVELISGSLPGFSIDFANGGFGTATASGSNASQGLVGQVNLDLDSSFSSSVALANLIQNIAMVDRKVNMTLNTGGNSLPSGGTNNLTLQFTLVDR